MTVFRGVVLKSRTALKTVFVALLMGMMTFALAGYAAQPEVKPKLYMETVARYRCVVCQNQSLAESQAPIALDMKRSIKLQLESGASTKEIDAFLVARYGEFVLLQPSFARHNWLLWFLPLLGFVGVVVALGVRLCNMLRGQDGPTKD